MITSRRNRCVDLIGQRFSDLVVIEFVGNNRHGSRRWKCKCDCGNTIIKRSHDIVSGRTNSCGCKTADHRALSSSRPYTAFNHVYSEYRQGAKKRDLEWKLDKELFKKLTKKDCYYCGQKPSKVYSPVSKYAPSYTYNGVDRLDSEKGYVPENCVPCCNFCNIAKGAMDEKFFIENILRVGKFQIKKAEKENDMF